MCPISVSKRQKQLEIIKIIRDTRPDEFQLLLQSCKRMYEVGKSMILDHNRRIKLYSWTQILNPLTFFVEMVLDHTFVRFPSDPTTARLYFWSSASSNGSGKTKLARNSFGSSCSPSPRIHGNCISPLCLGARSSQTLDRLGQMVCSLGQLRPRITHSPSLPNLSILEDFAFLDHDARSAIVSGEQRGM